MVSEDILLQTLSKKVLSIIKGKKSQSLHTTESFEILASSAAGAFIHGLEDEFDEVTQLENGDIASLCIKYILVITVPFLFWLTLLNRQH